MRLIPMVMAGLTALGTLTSLPLAASAAQPARVPTQSCRALTGYPNVWRADYWARIEDSFGHKQSVMYTPCFTSKADCEAWFYWAQSDWPDQIAVKRCYRVS